MRVLIVDDEPIARRRLVRMLARIDDVDVAGQAGDGLEAIEQIAELRPDAVLLDIRMPKMDGLTVAKTVKDMPPVIFTTAYDEYAVAAFDACAVDYLLKPIKQERLEQAISKLRGRGADQVALESLLRLLDRQEPDDAKSAHRIVVRDGDTLRVFDARQICRFYSSDKYSVFVSEGQEQLLDESLGSLETRLEPFGFLRVHRGELVRVDDVVALTGDGSGGSAELRDGQRVRVSRRHIAELRRALRID
jgi:DNA-binding LytR/AlgR family response regulator